LRRFSPHFFVVFEPGVLERAPQSLIALARVPDPNERAELQRDVVLEFPNVSVLDLAALQQTLDTVLGHVGTAVRFLALFTIVGGLIVLVGALANSRFQRLRESALIKTLGGSRRMRTPTT
jgi:putative ABC transport system permease protein